MSSTLRSTGVFLAGAALLAGCSDSTPLEPAAGHVAVFSTSSHQTLVTCPSSVTRSVSGTFGLLGGSLELDGTSVRIPFGAVLLPTRITLTLPAAEHMEVDLTANALKHFAFPVPVTVTIDYSRCPASSIDEEEPLRVWYVDALTHLLLENMGGRVDPGNHSITFSTIHFSGFSIAQ